MMRYVGGLRTACSASRKPMIQFRHPYSAAQVVQQQKEEEGTEDKEDGTPIINTGPVEDGQVRRNGERQHRHTAAIDTTLTLH